MLKNMKDTNAPSGDVMAIELKLTIYNTASRLQLPAIPISGWGELVKNACFMELQGFPVPGAQEVAITSVCGQRHLDDGDLELWGDVLNLCRAPEQWNPNSNCRFANCKLLMGITITSGHHSNKVTEPLLSVYQKACFGDVFVKLVSDAADESGSEEGVPEKAAGELVKLCETFLRPYATQDPPTEALAGFLKPSISIFRGLAALSSPIPSYLGSALHDVEYICPTNGTQASVMAEVCCRGVGRIIVNKLRSPLWHQRLAEYRKARGSELEFGEAVQAAIKQSYDLVEMISQDDVAAFVSKVDDWLAGDLVQQWTLWKASDLRTGFSEVLEDNLAKIIKHRLHLCSDDKSAAPSLMMGCVSAARNMQSVLKCVRESIAKPLMQDVVERLTSWQQRDTASRTDVAVDAYLAWPSMANLTELVKILKAGESNGSGFDKTSAKMQQVCTATFRWIGVEAGTGDDAIHPGGVPLAERALVDLLELLCTSEREHTVWLVVVKVLNGIEDAVESCQAFDEVSCAEDSKGVVENLAHKLDAREQFSAFKEEEAAESKHFEAYCRRAMNAIEQHELVFENMVSKLFNGLCARIQKTSGVLKQVCNGWDHGKHWYEARFDAEDILECYKRTLAVVNKNQIEKCEHAVTEASMLVTSNIFCMSGCVCGCA